MPPNSNGQTVPLKKTNIFLKGAENPEAAARKINNKLLNEASGLRLHPIGKNKIFDFYL